MKKYWELCTTLLGDPTRSALGKVRCRKDLLTEVMFKQKLKNNNNKKGVNE